MYLFKWHCHAERCRGTLHSAFGLTICHLVSFIMSNTITSANVNFYSIGPFSVPITGSYVSIGVSAGKYFLIC